MNTKTILLDGGPMDGQLVEVYEHETIYECFSSPDLMKGGLYEPIPPPIKHVYKEDPNVQGHFIYQQNKP